ncbi:MAG: Lrp/AsnC family transcriptional regulator [Nanoarchaeota archaeon]|nr:Lrp/AsnC family transcriptional regulator [Nanoarchaeota archaeon]
MKGQILMQRREERVDLDKKNQVILQMLINNSRSSISKISKIVKISKPAVLQRIRQMEGNKIILQYIAYYNLIRAGYKFHTILLEIGKENELIYAEKLSCCKFTCAVIQLAHKFNILWMVFSKNQEHLNEIISEVNRTMKVKDLKVLPIVDYYFDNYELFAGNKKKITKTHNKKIIKLDKIDAKILNVLKNNSRESLVGIANQCKITAEAIKKRINKLEENGVILSFFTNFNIFKLGFQPYVILIKTNRQKQKEIINFIRQHKNTNGQYLIDDEFDLMCVIVVKDISELRGFINQAHSLFRDNIIDYEIYLMIDQIFNDFFPLGIYEDIQKISKKDLL